MKLCLTLLIVLCGLGIGLAESVKLRMRCRELSVLSDAFSALKCAAEYTAGDFHHLLHICQDNDFIACIPSKADPLEAWKHAVRYFFTNAQDKAFAQAFIDGYGKTDLNGTIAYISLYEEKTMQRLRRAECEAETKCRLYTVLGFFFGVAAALLVI